MRLSTSLPILWAATSNFVLGDTQPWLNTFLSTEDRLSSFLSQLNLTQKLAMVQGDTELDDNGTGISACIGHISGNDMLSIPSICMGDGPEGVGNSLNNVTTFPAPVCAAASWNTSLEYVFGQALAEEHMAKGRNVVLAPTINIVRSPLWARAAESYTEDPFLAARMAVAGTKGIQTKGAVACPKHFAAYNQDTNRFGLDPEWTAVNAIVSKRTLHELYLPAFKAAVQEGDAGSVMCSYNRLNGEYTCENSWLLNTTLRQDWGFQGYVLADWYFADRSTEKAVKAGLDISMPGGDLTASYGFPAYYGSLLAEAVANGSVSTDRIDDMVRRLWRPMFKLGLVDDPVTGDSLAYARTQAHLDLAQSMAEDGAVLLKNDKATLPLSNTKYKKIAVFGVDATDQAQISENHGGFVIDSTTVVSAPLDALKVRGEEKEGILVDYAEAYPGTGQFATVDASLFLGGGLNATYYTTADFSGPINQTVFVPNITAGAFPSELWQAWPQVFSAVYTGVLQPDSSGVAHFSMTGQGDALLYLDDVLVANMSKANFGNTVQGVANLTEGKDVKLRLEYQMGYSLSTGAYGVTLGASLGNTTRDTAADALAESADISIIFASDRVSEGADSNLGLSLPGDQDAVIARIASLSKKTLVVLNTNSAVLMPWVDSVDAVLEAWYAGQQTGLALERLLFGDVSPSGKLPVSFPARLEDAIGIEGGTEVVYAEGLDVGYRWLDRKGVQPLFAFGHGLTYTEWDLDEGMQVTRGNGTVVVSGVVRNVGDVQARQVVQLYVAYPEQAAEPVKVLKGFEKVGVGAGENTTVKLEVKEEDLRIWDESVDGWRLVSGDYVFMMGFSAADLRANATVVL